MIRITPLRSRGKPPERFRETAETLPLIQMERHNRYLGLKIALCVIGAVSGVSIFVSFAVFNNVNAAIWGLLSGIFAIIVLRLHVSHKRKNFVKVYTQQTLRHLKQFGVFGSFAAIVAALTYFILALVLKQGYKTDHDGYMPAAIFSLLTLKWTAFLICHCKNYEEMYFINYEEVP